MLAAVAVLGDAGDGVHQLLGVHSQGSEWAEAGGGRAQNRNV